MALFKKELKRSKSLVLENSNLVEFARIIKKTKKKGDFMNYERTLVAISLLAIISMWCRADQVTIYNHTSDTVYASIYYVESSLFESDGPAQRIIPIFSIPPYKLRLIERPTHKFGLRRDLIFSLNQEDLQPILDKTSWQSIPKIRVDALHGSTFHIAFKNDALKGYDQLRWTVKNLHANFTDDFAEIKENYSHHDYASMQAVVTRSNEIVQEEYDFQQNRKPIVKDALENALGITLSQNNVPRICACLSGGGMRAVIGSYALLESLRQLQLINALTYISSLSGSTWFLSTWLMSGLDLESYKDFLYDSLTSLQLFDPLLLGGRLWPKYVFGQHISIVDLYGVYLANTFYNYVTPDKANTELEKARQQLKLSMMQIRTQYGDWPFPLFTCGEATDAFHWCTFTPYQFSNDTLDYSIPIWSFGRQFKQGKSVDIAPEFSLGFMMGIWGSALSGNIEQMLETESQSLNKTLYDALDTIVNDIGIGQLRLFGIEIGNPLYHSKNAPFENEKHLFYVDGGYNYNIPLLTLLHAQRNAQIIFILDVSDGVQNNAPDMQKAVKELTNLGYSLPPIDFKRAVTDPISIFSDPQNPEVPTIIYVAPIKNDRYDKNFDPKKEMEVRYATERFIYNVKDINKFAGLLIFNILDNQELIFKAIKEKIESLQKIAIRA